MQKLLIYLLYLGNLAILIGLWWWMSFSQLNNPSLANSFIQFGKLAGIIATYQALLQLILIGRVKWVESFFGLDKLSKVHRWNGYLVLALITTHVFLIIQGYSWLSDTNYLEQSLTLINNWEDVLKAFLAYLILLVTIGLSITIIRRRLKYEWWYWVHLLNYLTFFLFVLHQLNFGLSAQSQAFKYYWVGLYVFAFGNIIAFRFLLPIYRLWKYRFEVQKVEPINQGLATSIYIKGKNLHRLKLKAGQFFIYRFLQKGFWYEAHPFSLSIAPNGEFIRLTAKNLGDYTSKLPQIKAGTKVLIDGPHGIFTSEQATTNKFLLIAGGIGITPLRSLAEELIQQNKDAVLIYGAKSKDELVLLDELKKLQKNSNFKLITCLSDETASGHIQGYIDKKLIQKYIPDLLSRDVYLCGPPIMMDKLKPVLLNDLSLPKRQFHWERFAL